ncbi:efflux RND transporter permease subunit [Amphiplicatus metriothermophilus]|uniref:Hydrophobic/amphiphilic exporter-1, HAE1 family n=1 Tax=Amphiplicatus metriothermophilus TaxID=1519374 RepID=A0A239PXJ5_9PROT|nr:efflux RND transporter permease subunit [Amphiplicatus metriothermophilus]MBB5520001.1 HAE1 family hydrophobic/amphiphilic exporter-1 [Amphiplicatus metriothermophilus]SNT74900.1 hydrophobic/amphiphilic exporter-1, HAE1 family [Amphiplicatus metriothermophilus]
MTDSPSPATITASSSFVALFIKRPILSSVLSMLIVIAGLAALFGVEVRELPDVDQPIVTVSTSYPGATPESIDAEVTAIIENAVAQVDGVQSISSSSSYARSSVTIEFSPNVDINIAATDVKNAVSAIQRNLPVGAEEPSVVKADSDGSPIMRLAVFAPGMAEGALGDLIERIIQPRLQAVEGVASVDAYGVRKRVIRIRLDPVQLAARGVAVDDVARLVARSTLSAPSGTLMSGRQELLIRTEAPAATPEEIAGLRINEETRLGDIAVVEWDVEKQTRSTRLDDAPAAGLAILRQAQSNTVAVADGVRAAIAELAPTLPPNVEIRVSTDDSIFIKRAIEEVAITLGIAVLIVVGVIFLFLRSARATLVPALAIPISLIGTLAAIYLAGFSINILTLLALVMATGLVVDDAIVVTENVERWRAMGYGRRAAALLGAKEIVFAVISTTATLAAVFVPISFLPGQAGRLFSEFGFVMAFAVLISSFVALTLCPMLTAKLAPSAAPGGAKKKPGPIERFGHMAAGVYAGALRALLRRPLLPFIAAGVFAAGAVTTFNMLPKELTPPEDRGRLFIQVRVQQSASFDYLEEKIRQVEDRLAPIVESGDVRGVLSIAGAGGGNSGFIIVQLKDWSARKRTQQEIEAAAEPLISSVPGAQVFLRRGNSLGIRGAGQGLQFAVAADDYEAAADVAEEIAARLDADPRFTRAALNFELSQPQLDVRIDRDAAAKLGVDVSSVTTLLSAMADEYRAAEIFAGETIVEVLLSAQGERVDDPSDLANLFVRTSSGQFVPLSILVDIEETAVPARLSREERRRAAPVTASLAPGTSLGEATRALREAAAEILPNNMAILLLGEARLLQTATDSSLIVFAFAGLVVLLVLAAQFESFISALVIMATVPFGLAAAIYAMAATGVSFNYYSQIGLVLLIGIMAKNGILIVEFANQLRDEGADVRAAIEEAARTRLRPVLMTALSTVLGGLPLILSSGAGSEARSALGWIVIGGLGFSTLFTLFLTPSAYLMLARFAGARAREGALVRRELAEAAARNAASALREPKGLAAE